MHFSGHRAELLSTLLNVWQGVRVQIGDAMLNESLANGHHGTTKTETKWEDEFQQRVLESQLEMPVYRTGGMAGGGGCTSGQLAR